jgi:large subunit ribosomal protein L10
VFTLIRALLCVTDFLLPKVANATGKVNRMARPDKEAAVAELAEDFRTAQATVLTEYRGLTVTAMKQLRRALGTDTKYSVVKNTLTKIAAKNAGVEISDDLLIGPSAVAFIKGDPITAAKSLRDFQKENPLLIIKGGIYEGKAVTPAELMELANLESREVLLAKLAGAMKASMAKAAATFDALRAKLEAGAPAAPVAPVVESAPVVEEAQVATEEVVAETTPEVVAEVAVVTEPVADVAVAEVPAQDANTPETPAE